MNRLRPVLSRAERGLASIGLIASVAAIVGAAGLGSVLVLSGVIDLVGEPAASASTRTAATQLLDCRGGVPVDSASDGDSVFVVGIDASGEWVAIRRPSALEEVGWLPSSLLESEEELSSLPVLPCGGTGDNATLLAEEPATTESTVPTTDTTMPTTESTVPTTNTTMPPPADTTPPQVFDFLVLPEEIYPGACDAGTYDILGSAYATVVNEVEPVTATLTWRYMPSSYEYSGSFPVSVEPAGSGFQLIGSISDLPQPYRFGWSAPKIVVELTWTVTDGAGNPTVVVVSSIFEVGRCV